MRAVHATVVHVGIVVALIAPTYACDRATVHNVCGVGRYREIGADRYCLYGADQVASAGISFDCPPELPARVDVRAGVVCTNVSLATAESLPPDLCAPLGEPCVAAPVDAGADAAAAGCGDRVIVSPEPCDDGNAEALDGCAGCRLVPAVRIVSGTLVAELVEGCDPNGDGIPDNALSRYADDSTLADLAHEGPLRGPTWDVLVIDDLDFLVFSRPFTDFDVAVAFLVAAETTHPLLGPGALFATNERALVSRPASVGADGIRVELGVYRLRLVETGVEAEGISLLDTALVGSLSGEVESETITGFRGHACGYATANAVWGHLSDVLALAPALDDGSTVHSTDVDVDGDGLERFVVRDGRVASCIDPSAGELLGESCLAMPEMADGFSMVLALEGDGARIHGAQLR